MHNASYILKARPVLNKIANWENTERFRFTIQRPASQLIV